MSRLFLCLTLLASAGCASTPGASEAARAPQSPEATTAKPTALAGAWEGHIELPNGNLGFLAQVGEDGTGTVDIPAQGAKGLPLSVVREEGEEVELLNEVPGANVVFKGRREGDAVRGTFTQRGNSFPFVLVRKGAASPQPSP